ncbi:cobalamin-binding protein [archaeon]|nr:MAG: cobalamin-binding protein [archaeon]HDM23354.1 radical SAM protein [Candidatus Bathyarchaeota archaeon]
MKVLLIEPFKKYWPLIGESTSPPLGLLYLASYVRENSDHDIKVIDCQVNRMKLDKLESIIEREAPDVVGVGSITPYVYDAVRVFELAKEIDEGIVTVAGGPHFTFTVEESLRDFKCIDVIVRGEGEITLLELLNSLEKNGFNTKSLKKIKGISFRLNGKPVSTSDRPLIKNVDSIPWPAYDMVPMRRYRFVVFGEKYTMILGSRGCPFRCRFCSEWRFWRGCWRPRNPVNIVDEMEFLHEKYGKEIFWFADDTFNVNGERIEAFCRELMERGLDFKWYYEGRIDYLLKYRRLLPLMEKTGNIWVLLGVEGASDHELKYYRKELSIEQIKKAFKLLKRHNIISQAMFVIGHRKETRESIMAKVKLSKKIGADFTIFTMLTPFPGSDIYEEAKRNGWIEVYDYSKYDMLHAVMPTETLSRNELQKLFNEAYRKVYGGIMQRLTGIFSRNPWKRKLYRYMIKTVIKKAVLSFL